MTLAKLSYYAFDIGMILVGVAFILFVVHTTLLAAGRRRALAAAGAGGGTVTVSDSANETSAGSIAHAFTWTAFVSILLGLIIRAYLVGRGPWGNLYEFSVAFAFGDHRFAICSWAGATRSRPSPSCRSASPSSSWATRSRCPRQSARSCRRSTIRRC